MDLITARFNVPFKTGPQSASTTFILPVDGPILTRLAVFSALESYDVTKVGWRVFDGGGRQIVPAGGLTDATAVFAGRGSWAPLMPKGSGFWIENLDDELTVSPPTLKFDFYNEDAADFVALVFVECGQDLRGLAVNVRNFTEFIQPIGGMIQDFINKILPPKE